MLRGGGLLCRQGARDRVVARALSHGGKFKRRVLFTGWVGLTWFLRGFGCHGWHCFRLAYNKLRVEGGEKVAAALAECQSLIEVKSVFFPFLLFQRAPHQKNNISKNHFWRTLFLFQRKKSIFVLSIFILF